MGQMPGEGGLLILAASVEVQNEKSPVFELFITSFVELTLNLGRNHKLPVRIVQLRISNTEGKS